MLSLIILIIVVLILLAFSCILTHYQDKEHQENVKRSVEKLRKIVSNWNSKRYSDVDVDYEERKNETINRVKKEIHDVKFYNTLIRIAKSNLDNDYDISNEDAQFRREFIKKYLFGFEELKKCNNSLYENINHSEELEESCKEFFYDEIEREYRVDIIKLEYINYLFFRALDIFLKEPKNKKAFKPYLEKFIKKSMDERIDTNVLGYYFIYYPMKMFDVASDAIIKSHQNIFGPFRPTIKTSDIRVNLIKGVVERRYQMVSFSDNLCYGCFKNIYKKFINDVEYFIADAFSEEFLRLEKDAAIKEKYQKKEKNKKISRGKMIRRSKREAVIMSRKRKIIKL